MVVSSIEYQKYITQLRSDRQDLAIKAAHALGDLGDQRAVPVLIEILQTTTHSAIRDAVAVGLRELKDERAIQPLVSLIADPKTEGHRGTLIYALEEFDCTCLLDFLVDLVITGNFEVSHQAFLAITSIESGVDPETLDSLLQQVKIALPEATPEKVELISDLKELLMEMKLTSVE